MLQYIHADMSHDVLFKEGFKELVISGTIYQSQLTKVSIKHVSNVLIIIITGD